MEIRNRLILTTLLVFLMCTTLVAQKVETNSMGKVLAEFIDSKKVIDNFKHWSHQQDSLIVFVDISKNSSIQNFSDKYEKNAIKLVNFDIKISSDDGE